MDDLLQRIEQKEAELIALTQDLIRFPTINPPGEAYAPCAHYIGDRLAKRGFDVRYIRALGTPGDSDLYPRINVIARKEGSNPGPCIHFNSHIDVVEVGNGWTKDPFSGAVEEGKIYGRGACDMKGGLAASIIATESYIDHHPDFAGAIEISGTCDEESGGYGGVAYLAKQGFFDKDRVDHVIIPEPLNKDRICLGHRGVWWAEIETHGHIAHGSMPFLGDCAVRHMGAVLEEFEQKLYPALAKKQTTMPVVPPGARQSTLNINSIHGGQSEEFDGLPAPCVPDSCRMVIDRRFLIEEKLDQVKSEITELLDDLSYNRSKFSYQIKDLFEVQPTMTDQSQPVVKAVSAAISDILDKEADYVISPGTYDQKHIDRIGKLKDCIAYGPGILDLAHQPDEYVGIADMLDCAKVMANAIHRLLNQNQH
ncbi:MAG: acetylornithine deacetylase/succinyl-diaminopimelate desuccinylase family protein [Cohaesibacter sp.]|nr:acetylornithine deacetylase/succinyl-diaminopimelate desuccinylase family protein [Cohaesibacter sp.]MCV6600047.1 acetylornithine deacetylase/succinyl-diaminopimelate desuccinylase family protein [Cohaesibacter sp.]